MLTLRPEIKIFVRPVGQRGENIILGCFVVAKYQDGHSEIVKTAYKEISRAEYESGKEFYSEHFSETEKVLAISGDVLKTIFKIVKSTFTEAKVSPYTDFSFFVSQPTRAPAN